MKDSPSIPRRAVAPSGPFLLRALLFRQLFRRFLGGEIFLLSIILLAELFASMWRFLAMNAPLGGIMLWLAAGIPAHILEALPIAYLFGITLSLAEMHADGELIAVWGSGVSVRSLSLPVLFFSVLLSFSMFAFNDAVAVSAQAKRDRLFTSMTGQQGRGASVEDVAIISSGGKFIYRIGSYDSASQRLVDVDIVERDSDGALASRLLAPDARWAKDRWLLRNARVFFRDENGAWSEETLKEYSRPDLSEDPSTFVSVKEKPAFMRAGELAAYAARRKASGLPSAEAETELYKRYAFVLTPLIVYGLALVFAGLFRKNAILMSLLFSLCTATVYYVAQMLGALAAKTGWIPPALGVWGVSAVFLAAAAWGYAKAKT